MSDPLCTTCERPMPDQAYGCAACRDRAVAQLVGDPDRPERPGITDAIGAARDIATGQASHSRGGGSSGKPGSKLPFDLTATAKLDAVASTLTTWARHIAETRGVTIP